MENSEVLKSFQGRMSHANRRLDVVGTKEWTMCHEMVEGGKTYVGENNGAEKAAARRKSCPRG